MTSSSRRTKWYLVAMVDFRRLVSYRVNFFDKFEVKFDGCVLVAHLLTIELSVYYAEVSWGEYLCVREAVAKRFFYIHSFFDHTLNLYPR